MKSNVQPDDVPSAPHTEERRTLEELISRYQLEPTIHDIYVEGEFDKEIVEAFLKNAGLDDRAAVYEIQTVDVAAALVVARQFDVGNKGRTLALGLALCENIDEAWRLVTCIVDVDVDHFYHSQIDCRCVLYTDYVSMELYLLSAQNVARLSERYFRRPADRIRTALDELTPSLQELFLVRAAKGTDEFDHLILPDIGRCLSRELGNPRLNHTRYMQILLQRGRMMPRYKDFEAVVGSSRSSVRQESRHQMHFDDVIDTLCWIAIRVLNIDFAIDSRSLKRTLLILMNMEELKVEPLFVNLMTRIRAV